MSGNCVAPINKLVLEGRKFIFTHNSLLCPCHINSSFGQVGSWSWGKHITPNVMYTRVYTDEQKKFK